MNERTRKTLCLIIGAAALGAALLMGFRLMNGYGHTVPLAVGPYKKTGFILAALVLLFRPVFIFVRFPGRRLPGHSGSLSGSCGSRAACCSGTAARKAL